MVAWVGEVGIGPAGKAAVIMGGPKEEKLLKVKVEGPKGELIC